MSFRYLAEANALVVILAGGDIVVISLEEELSPDQEKVRLHVYTLCSAALTLIAGRSGMLCRIWNQSGRLVVRRRASGPYYM